jgi:hypothetical protein
VDKATASPSPVPESDEVTNKDIEEQVSQSFREGVDHSLQQSIGAHFAILFLVIFERSAQPETKNLLSYFFRPSFSFRFKHSEKWKSGKRRKKRNWDWLKNRKEA